MSDQATLHQSPPVGPSVQPSSPVVEPIHASNLTTCRTPVGSISGKVQAHHWERMAIVYVRQSSPNQVKVHRESTARQYAFSDQAVSLGWRRDRVLIIDEDLGKSGRTTEGRTGLSLGALYRPRGGALRPAT